MQVVDEISGGFDSIDITNPVTVRYTGPAPGMFYLPVNIFRNGKLIEKYIDPPTKDSFVCNVGDKLTLSYITATIVVKCPERTEYSETMVAVQFVTSSSSVDLSGYTSGDTVNWITYSKMETETMEYEYYTLEEFPDTPWGKLVEISPIEGFDCLYNIRKTTVANWVN